MLFIAFQGATETPLATAFRTADHLGQSAAKEAYLGWPMLLTAACICCAAVPVHG